MDPTLTVINFLQEELLLPADSIPVVLQHCEHKLDRLPVVLWQQKLVSVAQLDRIFAWMENYMSKTNVSKTKTVSC